jgi:small neutral amino acid transporter SnatA (MarC family)
VSLQILPLAITMMVGPQILSAIIFVTSKRAVPTSLAYLAGVAIATAVGVAIAFGIAGPADREVDSDLAGAQNS